MLREAKSERSRRQVLDARDHRNGVAEPLLDHLREEDDGQGEEQREPESVPEHGNAVSGVLVVPTVMPAVLRFNRAATEMKGIVCASDPKVHAQLVTWLREGWR